MFVISSSQLGAEEEDVAKPMRLAQGETVHHYWDGGRRVGSAVQHVAEGLGQPAWDFWMLYAPGRTWGDGAAAPDWWEHQMSSLMDRYAERLLDAERFARKAKAMAAP